MLGCDHRTRRRRHRLVRRRRSLRIAGRRRLRREGCGPGNTTSPRSRGRRSPSRSVTAGSCVHGVVQRRDARRPTTRTGPPRPWRWRRNRHPRHPGRQSPRRPRRSYRGFGGQIEPLPRIGRGYSHQLSRQRLRSITRRSHRQPRRRRGSGQHGSVVPRAQRRRTRHGRPRRDHRNAGWPQGRSRHRQADGKARKHHVDGPARASAHRPRR